MENTTNEEPELIEKDKHLSLARPLAPEDIRRNTYVAVLTAIVEFFPFWQDEPWRPAKVRRLDLLPGPDGGTPLRVKEVCLPYILVEHPGGQHRTLDVRRFRLGQLSQRYGERAFRRLATPALTAAKPGCGTT
jgi:hypothetical protein